MKISDAFPSNYLKAADLGGRTARARINIVKFEEIGSDHKPVLYFEGKDKGLVLNKTNASTIAMAYGDDTDGWGGADVELFPMSVPFQGQMVPAIRVRVPAKESAQNGFNGPGRASRQAEPPQDRFAPPPQSAADFDDEIPF